MTKRSSEDLVHAMSSVLQNDGAVDTNGCQEPLEANNNAGDAPPLAPKKVKLEANGPSKGSRVVHVRNIPADTCEADLIGVALAFGRVTNCLVLRGKSQAFVEFDASNSAQQMVSYWTQTTCGGVATTLQPTIRGRHVFCQLSNHKELKVNHMNNDTPPHMDSAPIVLRPEGRAADGASCVLRVVVENLVYPVSLDVLHSVFSRAGKVAKIVTFTKNGSFQALIQFAEAAAAMSAKHALDGQCLFHSSNTLRIEFSKLQTLNVKYNNDKSRDYTNPALPAVSAFAPPADSSPALMEPSLMSSLMQSMAPPTATLFANPFAVGAGHALRAIAASQMAMGGASAVLLVSNLNESTTTTEALFTLFGVYGDVVRVKILFNKKDNALVQMAEPSQAHLALTYLDKVKLFGRTIRVTQSKHALVQMPKEGQHDAGLTKDFSQSPLHRFKKPGSKNYGNIYPPSATLHLSNIPQTVTEEDIRQAFAKQTNSTIVAFKFFPKDRKMALIQLSSVEEAINALIQMHNYQLSESSHLRVSFSKSSI